MTPKTYDILSRCIEEGIQYGYAKAFMGEDNPTENHVLSQIHFAVMQHINMYFEFDKHE